MKGSSKQARWLLGLALVAAVLAVILVARPLPATLAQTVSTPTGTLTRTPTELATPLTATVEVSPTLTATPMATLTPTRPVTPGLPETGEATDLPRTITVVGEGRVQVSPDLATANIGVTSVATTVLSATQQVSETMNDVLAALMDQGVAQEDIQTTSYNINLIDGMLIDEAANGAARPPRYQVSNSVQVTIRDISNIGPIMDAAVGAGANQVFGVTFDISSREEVNQQALEEAVQNAAQRAQLLSDLADVTLGPIVSISQVISQPGIFGVAAEAGVGMGGAAPGPISPGQLEVVMQLQVTYALQ